LAPEYSRFFAFNAVVHLLDALLVAGIVWRIERLRQGKVAASVWLAVSVGMLWAVLPIHVSTTLIVVQRMTSLSALFVLLGLYFFLLGLEMEQTRPRAGGYLQGAAIVMGTLLAALSKENGLLLPVLAGVTEYTLLQGVTANPGTRRLRLRLCGAYSLLILLALLWQAWASGGVFPGRNFDLKERLLTEPQILFEYLAHAFAPGIATFHPFHEGHPKVVSWQESPLALLAALAWLLALGASGSLRRRHPVLAFAVLWFLAAHLLESSVIGLELYFEHRNHVALFGPCLALVWYIRQVPEKYRRLAIGGFSAYLVLLTLVLGQVTSLWGKPLEAAEDWFLAAHKSPRAAEHLANQYLEAGKGAYALEVMEMQVKDCPECLSSHLQAMLLNCMAGDAEKTQRYYESARLLSQQVASSAGPRGIVRRARPDGGGAVQVALPCADRGLASCASGTGGEYHECSGARRLAHQFAAYCTSGGRCVPGARGTGKILCRQPGFRAGRADVPSHSGVPGPGPGRGFSPEQIVPFHAPAPLSGLLPAQGLCRLARQPGCRGCGP